MNSKQNNVSWRKYWWVVIVGIFLLVGAVAIIWWPKFIKANWDVVLDFVKNMGWPFVVLVAIIVLNQPLGYFLKNLGESLGRIKMLKIGDNLAFSADEIIEVLVEREKLKMGILVACATDGINKKEANYLWRLAYPMNNEVQRLNKEQKTKVLEESINMALMDGKVQKEEYVQLGILASIYNYGKSDNEIIDLNDLIAKACYLTRGEYPPQIKEHCSDRAREWEKEKKLS